MDLRRRATALGHQDLCETWLVKALIMLLDKPIIIANHENHSLEMQLYGFDKTMAPEGKGIIKVELVSGYSYWKQLYTDKQKYEEEKQKAAGQVIDILENYFHGIKNQIEVMDVPTPDDLGAVYGRHSWV